MSTRVVTPNWTLTSKRFLTAVLKGVRFMDWQLGNARYQVQGVSYALVTLHYARKCGVDWVVVQSQMRLKISRPEDILEIDRWLRQRKYNHLRRVKK